MLSNILTALVAIEHLYILYMEMFAWETRGKGFFKSLPEHLFGPTKCLLQVYMALLRHRVRFSFSKLCQLYWQVLPQCCLYKQTLGLEKLLSKPSVCFYIIYQM